jgi:threonine aldolase
MKEQKIFLRNDYGAVAHGAVFDALREHLDEHYEGYGTDCTTKEAEGLIHELIQRPEAKVHFLTGGTLANLVSVAAFLRPHEAVIAPFSAHISMHETGAIEASGHKILACETPDGKLRPDDIIKTVALHTDEHMVKPRMVYISQTTELGSVYSLTELTALREVCDEYSLFLYIDGARLASALTAECADFTLPQIAELADAFYLGGTKNGLLFGEALIICNPALQEDFRFIIKQRGGLLAKGFLLGIQFKALLANDLYLQTARQANIMAAKLTEGLRALGYAFQIETESNQIFPIVGDDTVDPLFEQIDFEVWARLGARQSSIRFVTTWKTTEGDVKAVLQIMGAIKA